MNRRLIASTLGASMLAPGAAALADPEDYWTGITLVGMAGNQPMSGFSAGGSLKTFQNRPGSGLNYGGFFQFEVDFDGDYRINVGGQANGSFVGAELGYSFTFGDASTSYAVIASPFIGNEWINAAWRNVYGTAGYQTGGAVSLNAPWYMPLFLITGVPSGRPLRDADGATHRPRVVVLGRRSMPAIAADLPRESREALGRAWLEDARDEHAAVDAFFKLARQLRRRGAPSALVERALRSARDEQRHARDCLNIAEALLGLRLGLVSTPLADGPTPDLAAMAVESRLDGVVAEGAAARIAALGAGRATVGPVERLQSAIAREEAGHAGLGAEIAQWAVEAGGAPVRAALADARAADADEIEVGPSALAGDEALWRRWGRALAPERRAAWHAATA